MKQIFAAWGLLDLQKKVVVALAIVATLTAFFGLVRLANAPNLALLYSGLDSATSSEIVASLEQKSIPFEIRGDAIYVDSSARDRARLTLAGEGLPSNGIAGYELLDSLSGFGTTSQMFDAAYWRAKEGELARTILASARISMARVHIANPAPQPFGKNVTPSASVTVSVKSGILDVGQAEAIRYLVAAAVVGMTPDQVTVIDAEYGVVLQPGVSGATHSANTELDARAAELRENIERLLAARVGAGNAVVEVMIEAHSDSETVTERILDPQGSVPVSSETETSSENSSGGAGGAVTVASNLPDDGSNGSAGQNSSSQSQSRERVNYEISETVREHVRLPGDIARLSVAVLLNYEAITDDAGNRSFIARTEEEITAFQSLVQSAVGFNAERGDVVAIESMHFPEAETMGTSATSGMFSNFVINIPAMLQMAVLALVTLALGMFVVRPILTNPTPQLAQLPLSDPSTVGNLGPPDALAEMPEMKTLEVSPKDPVEILRETIALRSEESGHLLRNWIEADTHKQTEEVT